jgi:hypothetical protein
VARATWSGCTETAAPHASYFSAVVVTDHYCAAGYCTALWKWKRLLVQCPLALPQVQRLPRVRLDLAVQGMASAHSSCSYATLQQLLSSPATQNTRQPVVMQHTTPFVHIRQPLTVHMRHTHIQQTAACNCLYKVGPTSGCTSAPSLGTQPVKACAGPQHDNQPVQSLHTPACTSTHTPTATAITSYTQYPVMPLYQAPTVPHTRIRHTHSL